MRRVHLVTNPADDDDFGRFAQQALSGNPDLAEFRAALRERYPAAVVHERLLSGEATVIWYCYRDGRWVGRTGERGDDT